MNQDGGNEVGSHSKQLMTVECLLCAGHPLGGYKHPLFMDDNTDTQRGRDTWPKAHS